MGISSPSQALEALDAAPLSWHETVRQNLAQFFKEESIEAVRERFGDRIPSKGVGDVFRYKLEGANNVAVGYSQIIEPYSPFSNVQMLGFYFGQSGMSEHPLARAKGFGNLGLSDAKMQFTMGRYTDKNYVELQSQLLGLHRRGDRNNEFTEEGRATIQAIIDRTRKLLDAPGLRPEDQKVLSRLLANIKWQLKMKKLIPDDWQL